MAIEYKNLDVLKYAHNNNCPMDSSIIDYFDDCDDEDIISYIEQSGLLEELEQIA